MPELGLSGTLALQSSKNISKMINRIPKISNPKPPHSGTAAATEVLGGSGVVRSGLLSALIFEL